VIGSGQGLGSIPLIGRGPRRPAIQSSEQGGTRNEIKLLSIDDVNKRAWTYRIGCPYPSPFVCGPDPIARTSDCFSLDPPSASLDGHHDVSSVEHFSNQAAAQKRIPRRHINTPNPSSENHISHLPNCNSPERLACLHEKNPISSVTSKPPPNTVGVSYIIAELLSYLNNVLRNSTPSSCPWPNGLGIQVFCTEFSADTPIIEKSSEDSLHSSHYPADRMNEMPSSWAFFLVY